MTKLRDSIRKSAQAMCSSIHDVRSYGNVVRNVVMVEGTMWIVSKHVVRKRKGRGFRNVLLIAAIMAMALIAAAAKNKPSLPQGQMALPAREKEKQAEKHLPQANLQAFPPLDLSHCPRNERGERIVAIVEGTTITEKRLLAELAFARSQQQFTQFPVPKNKQEELGLLGALSAPVFDQLVERILINKYAREHGLVVTEAEVNAAIEKTNRDLPPGAKVQDIAVRYGLSMDDLRELARTQVLGARIEDSMADKVDEPTEEELLEFASKHVGPLDKGDEIRAAHIFFAANERATTQVMQASERMAREVHKMLKQGADFCELALRYSQDRKTATKCGDLGYLTRGKMPPAFDEAAFSLAPGQISDVVRTAQGFHIILVREKHAGCLRSSYLRYKQRELFLRWGVDLRRSAKIEKFF
ncbi:MAG: peptidylprolyl isomerase [Candidatus Sumerlaeaceae bacterium]